MDEINKLREHYDNTDLSASIERAERDDTVAADPMIGITVRFHKSVLDRVRSLAEARGVKATALIRELTERAIAKETDEQAVVSVADLQRLIAERSRTAA